MPEIETWPSLPSVYLLEFIVLELVKNYSNVLK